MFFMLFLKANKILHIADSLRKVLLNYHMVPIVKFLKTNVCHVVEAYVNFSLFWVELFEQG